MGKMSDQYRLGQDTHVDLDQGCSDERQNPLKRIYKFSDGYLEENENENENDEISSINVNNQQVIAVDPSTMEWMPWMWYRTTQAGTKVLGACDYIGEFLADFLGITSPKYQFEIDEYNRIKAEEEEQERKSKLEMTGWYEENKKNAIITSENNVGTHV